MFRKIEHNCSHNHSRKIEKYIMDLSYCLFLFFMAMRILHYTIYVSISEKKMCCPPGMTYLPERNDCPPTSKWPRILRSSFHYIDLSKYIQFYVWLQKITLQDRIYSLSTHSNKDVLQ